MAELEKVITEIEDALSGNLAKVGHVYRMSLNGLKDKALKDALALLKERKGLMLALEQSNAVNGYLNAEVERLNGLLKEQEAVKPKIDAFGHPYCPKCKILVYETWEFCPHCGQAVRWE